MALQFYSEIGAIEIGVIEFVAIQRNRNRVNAGQSESIRRFGAIRIGAISGNRNRVNSENWHLRGHSAPLVKA